MPPLRDPRGLQIIVPVLSNLAVAYRFMGGIYDQVVQRFPAPTDAFQWPEWSREDFLRDDVESLVDHRAETPEIDASYTLREGVLRERRLKVSISYKERQQAGALAGGGPVLRLEQSKLNLLLDRHAIRRERRLAAKLRKTTNGGQLTLGGTVATKWDAASGVTIEKDIKAARKAVYDATGQHVDTMIITWDVAYVMALDPTVREILKYTTPGESILRNGEQILPKVLHGLNVVVVDSDKINTARKGAVEALTSIWQDNVILIKRSRGVQYGQPATVYGFTGPIDSTQETAFTRQNMSTAMGGYLVDRWATPDPPVDYIRAWEKLEEKVVAADIGYEIADVLT